MLFSFEEWLVLAPDLLLDAKGTEVGRGREIATGKDGTRRNGKEGLCPFLTNSYSLLASFLTREFDTKTLVSRMVLASKETLKSKKLGSVVRKFETFLRSQS